MGAPWGGPLGSKIFYHNQKHYWHLLKSVTINKQGRRHEFSKVAPVWGAGGSMRGPGGLHGGPLGFPNFYQDPKTSLGTSRNSLKLFA